MTAKTRAEYKQKLKHNTTKDIDGDDLSDLVDGVFLLEDVGTGAGTICAGDDNRFASLSISVSAKADATATTNALALKADASAMTTALAGKQPSDPTLTALAAINTSVDTFIYATGPDTFSQATLTAFARTILDDVDAPAMRTTLLLPADSTAIMHSLESFADLYGWLINAYNRKAFALQNVAFMKSGSNHFFSRPGEANSYFNFQGTGGKTKFTFGGWFEITPTNAEEGGNGAGLINGMGLFSKCVIGNGTGGVIGCAFGSTGGQRLEFYVWADSTTKITTTFNNTATGQQLITFANGKPYFIYGEYDGNGATNADRLIVFICDALAGTVTQLTMTTGTGVGQAGEVSPSLPAQFQNPNGATNVWQLGKNFGNTSNQFGFDGRMWNWFTAGTLLGGGATNALAVATAHFNSGLSLTRAQSLALSYAYGTFWPLDEATTSIRQMAVDYSGNNRHLTRNNGIGYKQQVISYTCPYSGAVLIPCIKPDGTYRFAAGVPVARSSGAPDYDPNSHNIYAGIPGIVCRRGRGLAGYVNGEGLSQTGLYFDYVNFRSVPSTECFPVAIGNIQYVTNTVSPAGTLTYDINNRMVAFGVVGRSQASDNSNSFYVRFDGADLVSDWNGSGDNWPNASINCLAPPVADDGTANVDGTHPLRAGNRGMNLGTPSFNFLACTNTTSSGHASTQGPWTHQTIQSGVTYTNTLYIQDGGDGNKLPKGWLTLLPNLNWISIGGDPANDFVITLAGTLTKYPSAVDYNAFKVAVTHLPGTV